jgi:tRNA-binding EMAP/Myf-like protein
MKLTISMLAVLEPSAARALKPEYKNSNVEFFHSHGMLCATSRVDKESEIGSWMIFWNQNSKAWEE